MLCTVVSPDDLCADFAAVKNAAGSGATGLIQFMPRTAQGLGTTTAKLAKRLKEKDGNRPKT